jgi:hypothetical protein
MVRQARKARNQPAPAGLPADRPPAKDLGDLRFRSLLTAHEWNALPQDVRRRFSKRVQGGATAVFIGRLAEQRANLFGRLLANAMRVIGAPLPISSDIDVPSVVTVTEDVATGGQIWTRLYANRTGFPQIIHSSKRFCGPTGLEEFIGCGISIALRISVEEGALVFRSAAYRLALGRLRMSLPKWLSPGALAVTHRETGKATFLFSLKLEHPVFGELLFQSGHYREERT